ncbi:hypothetical protein QQF64_002089 [Cirrhinus molitorella]|uniref:Uncharacterized protein n=1 Tax=Cirrhinus molitorella TaxID=172907 RepID=A0ABR3MP53_9TELE
MSHSVNFNDWCTFSYSTCAVRSVGVPLSSAKPHTKALTHEEGVRALPPSQEMMVWMQEEHFWPSGSCTDTVTLSHHVCEGTAASSRPKTQQQAPRAGLRRIACPISLSPSTGTSPVDTLIAIWAVSMQSRSAEKVSELEFESLQTG